MTHYEVLGVAPSASDAEVRRAYLELARRHHPDFNPAASSRRMQDLNAAWYVLGDPDRRQAYDRSLARPAPAPRLWAPEPDDHDDTPAARLPEDLAAPGEVRHRWLAIAPVALALLGVALAVVGVATNVLPLVALAGTCFLLSLGLFVLAPIVAMSDSARRSG